MVEEDVKQALNHAVQKFLERDAFLLEIRANERSITHRFAVYLENILGQQWDIDCEYNRNMEHVKRVNSNIRYPDIIVHKRGTSENLLVVEAKYEDEDIADDHRKLENMKSDPDFRYQFAVHLICSENGELKLEWV